MPKPEEITQNLINLAGAIHPLTSSYVDKILDEAIAELERLQHMEKEQAAQARAAEKN